MNKSTRAYFNFLRMAGKKLSHLVQKKRIKDVKQRRAQLITWLNRCPEAQGNVQWLRNIDPYDDVDPQQPRKIRRQQTRFIRQLHETALRAARNASTHAEAKQVLIECLQKDKSFALYLRNFENEASVKYLDGTHQPIASAGPVVLLTSWVNGQHEVIENNLVTLLSTRMPVIGLANSANALDWGVVPKLEVTNDDWFKLMAALVGEAQIVIISFQKPTASLRTELATIKRLNKQQHTLIVVLDDMDESRREVRDMVLLDENTEWGRTDHEYASRHLQKYGTVVAANDLEKEGIEIIDNILSGAQCMSSSKSEGVPARAIE